jgi:hypothetical protein
MNPQEKAAQARQEAIAREELGREQQEKQDRLNELVARADVARSAAFAAVRTAISDQQAGLSNILHQTDELKMMYRAQGGSDALGTLLAFFDGAQQQYDEETSG